MTPEVFVQYMDQANIEGMCLQAIHGVTEPFGPDKKVWKWHVPNEYVKKEFIDAFPGRFTGRGRSAYPLRRGSRAGNGAVGP